MTPIFDIRERETKHNIKTRNANRKSTHSYTGRLSPKLRDKLLNNESKPSEGDPTAEAIDETGCAAERAARQIAGRARQGVSRLKPINPQERMKQATVRKYQERIRHSGGTQVPTVPEETNPINPSDLCRPSAASSDGRVLIREKARDGTAPKTKSAVNASSIKTRQLVNQAAAKRPRKTIKTAVPGKAIRRNAGEQLRNRIEQQGRRKLAQQAKRTAKQAADLSRRTAIAVAKAAKALISALAGIVGGGVLIVVLCLILLVAAIAASPFGIFFSGKQTASTVTPQEAIQQINREYMERLDSMRIGDYDHVETVGHAPAWKDVMAVFACKTAGAEDGIDVTSFDTDRVNRLKAVFWDMTSLSSQVETAEISAQDEGEETSTERNLSITITAKTAQEMGAAYSFSTDQNTQLAELLDPENNEYWMDLLYGVHSADGEIVAVALSQVGNVGGTPYWLWYGFPAKVDWCACFVSWCANECGYIEAGIYPKFAGCTSGGMAWFQAHGQWMDGSYTPNPGDLIFFDWDGSGDADHVGIVEKAENGRVYTIEGNSGVPDAVRQLSYPIGWWQIRGYGVPMF